MRFIFLLLLSFLYGIPVSAQVITVDTTQASPDTILLMSGKSLVGFVRGESDDELKVRVPKKGQFKLEFVDIDLVFSVKHPSGKEELVYKQDTLFGNYFTPQEVRYFMQGERDARKSYHSPAIVAGGFVAGAAGSYALGPFFGLPAGFAYAGLTTMLRVKVKPNTVSHPESLKYDTYLLGYEKEARKRRIFRSMLAGVGGYVVGLATAYTVESIKEK
ncbi:MAG: hypothetical protein FD123_2003 [Bacteroidetes bacterium]|nr:MAG: hypothetical protein FD123_2003 [Bacteroidota bacterium]